VEATIGGAIGNGVGCSKERQRRGCTKRDACVQSGMPRTARHTLRNTTATIGVDDDADGECCDACQAFLGFLEGGDR
jgi:hypothetical protein